MIQHILMWLRRRHQLRVMRRLARLDAQISGKVAKKQRYEELAKQLQVASADIKCCELAEEIAALQVIRAHNFRNEDAI